MKAVGYVSLSLLTAFLLMQGLGIVANTLYGLHRWLRYNGLPNAVEVCLLGLVIYGLVKLAIDDA